MSWGTPVRHSGQGDAAEPQCRSRVVVNRTFGKSFWARPRSLVSGEEDRDASRA